MPAVVAAAAKEVVPGDAVGVAGGDGGVGGAVGAAGVGEILGVVGDIGRFRDAKIVEIRGADHGLGAFPGGTCGREYEGDQKSGDGDDH